MCHILSSTLNRHKYRESSNFRFLCDYCSHSILFIWFQRDGPTTPRTPTVPFGRYEKDFNEAQWDWVVDATGYKQSDWSTIVGMERLWLPNNIYIPFKRWREKQILELSIMSCFGPEVSSCFEYPLFIERGIGFGAGEDIYHWTAYTPKLDEICIAFCKGQFITWEDTFLKQVQYILRQIAIFSGCSCNLCRESFFGYESHFWAAFQLP